jgi:hypothetical protein
VETDPGVVDPRRGLYDVRMARRAIRERWNVRPEHRERLCELLYDVLTDSTAAPTARVNAARGILDADRLNLAQERMEREAERPGAQHLHLHQHGPGKAAADELRALREQLQALTGPEGAPQVGAAPPEAPPAE